MPTPSIPHPRFREWENNSMEKMSGGERQRNIWCTSAHEQTGTYDGKPLFTGNISKPISFTALQDLLLKVRRNKSNRDLLEKEGAGAGGTTTTKRVRTEEGVGSHSRG